MFYQIQNQSKTKFNQIAVNSKKDIFKAIKSQGWSIKDCSIKELEDSHKTGFTNLTGARNTRGKQYLNRKDKLNKVVQI